MMISYQVRSKDLIDLVNEVRSSRLILSPYFQRNLVWRDIHKHDFIDTILRGYPFPQIFISRGDIDVETMTAQSCVVDGQQRMNAIIEFVSDRFAVNGKKYSELDMLTKEEFLKYQIPVIDLTLKATDPSVIEIFQRLNRTFYALSSIEKMATEYASIDLMLIAKYLCGMLDPLESHDDDELKRDPNMPHEFRPWAIQFPVDNFRKLVVGGTVFTGYENSRMVHLMWTLNFLSTIRAGFFARNDKTRELLEDAVGLTPGRDRLLSVAERAASFFVSLDFDKNSIWWSKSNSFSLLVLFAWNEEGVNILGAEEVYKRLNVFASKLPDDYALAAREGVNNRQQRKLRHDKLASLLGLQAEEKSI